jgi:hypothetical protein
VRASWVELVGSVLRPSRPHLERCVEERERHLVARRAVAEERARAVADCEARIESARAAVFAARDGVVTLLMTELEREWRRLSRPDPEGGMMDLWARIAPPSWIDRKRWRDGDRAVQLDTAIALASDVDGVEAVEDALRTRVRWCFAVEDSDCTATWLAEPLRAAVESLAAGDIDSIALSRVLERARRIEQEVIDVAHTRLPGRPLLAQSVAHAAFVDTVWTASPVAARRPNPVTPLREVWRAGYAVAAIDGTCLTIELPPL